jgi:hypothetical protein
MGLAARRSRQSALPETPREVTRRIVAAAALVHPSYPKLFVPKYLDVT